MKKIMQIFISITVILTSLKTNAEEALPSFDSVVNFINEVVQKDEWADNLAKFASVNLPISIKKTWGDKEYILAVNKMNFMPNGASMDIYLRVATPGSKNKQEFLYFAATNIPWSEMGGFSTNEVKMALLNDYNIPFGDNIIVIKSGRDSIKTVEKALTFASVDCEGLKTISINADFVFSKQIILPPNCDSTSCNSIIANFNAQLHRWTELIVDINVPSFVLPKMPDWIFTAENAVFDFSESANSPISMLPEDYISLYYAENPEIWRGVYFKNISVEMPSFFKKIKNEKRFFFGASDLIIDEQGFSGNILSSNVVPANVATVGKWGVSVDTIALKFRANKLIKGGITGGLQLPTDSLYLAYTGIVGENNYYLFNVKLEDTTHYNFWKVLEMDLDNNSFIKFEKKDKEDVLLQANLHGKFSLKSDNLPNAIKNTVAKYIDIDGLCFSNLVLQNRQPYIYVDEMSYDKPIKIAGFSTQINSVGLRGLDDNRTSLNADVSVSLTSSNDGGFGGRCGFAIVSKFTEDDGKQKFSFEEIKLDKINVNIDQNAYAFKGNLEVFENDNLYGTGFSGAVDFSLKQMTLNLKLAATFGQKPDFKYWFIDGLCDLGKTGVPIFAGLQLSGFMGGAYQRMRQEPAIVSTSSGTSSSTSSGTTSSVGATSRTIAGVSASGVRYVPDKSVNLGIKAGVIVSLQSNPEILNGQVDLELAFNSNRGLNSIGLNGNLKALADLSGSYITELATKAKKFGIETNDDKEKERLELAKNAPITARANISYDFNNNCLTGLLQANIDAGLITGNGTAEMYFGQDKWYMYIGTPSKRFNVSLGYGSIKANAGVYLMAGHDIPAMPLPPSNVRSVLNNNQLQQLEQERSVNLLEGGRGLCFGSNLSASTGNAKFLMFYGSLSAGIGFDLMLKNYGDRTCKNSNSKLGLNGWYSSGQSYAYLSGTIGIDVTIFGAKTSVDILDVQTATLLESQLPNPVWFSGSVAADYSVLNGLVKGNCNFKFEIGEKCNISSISILDDVKVIADIKPYNGAKDIDVYTIPQAAFNLKIGSFSMNNKIYRIELQTFSLYKNGKEVARDIIWNADNTVFSCVPQEVLIPNSEYELKVEVTFKEKIGSNFVIIKNENGNQKRTTKNLG
ncbi:hypothetical protein FACS1894153_3300 [Bacteroidia bacterium]|nr:hypothetical protein FACS1894153_3300 [Bacteroidia bacterium]